MQAIGQMRAAPTTMETPPPVSRPSNPIPPTNQAPPASGTPVPPAAAQAAAPAPPGAAATSFAFQVPAGPVQNGATFQVPVLLNGGADVSSVPLQFRYDPNLLNLVNVTGGALLSKDGQAMALIHRDDGPGNVTVVASRPPGTLGVSGSGVVCVLTFQAKAAGSAALTMTRAGMVNSKQQQVQAAPAQAEVVVK